MTGPTARTRTTARARIRNSMQRSIRTSRSFCNKRSITQMTYLPFSSITKTDLIWRDDREVQELEIGFRRDVCNGSDS
ncbi:hypothetical protein CDAR_236041 [Caerostris darwini]|uniref:Uncharacterized protein n=1 Tax=Caerostris darwini TaxID=1538125 RepID=A0AAV4UG55_9ARAC|nr:hypothetical protein CDAR_236041 [Caerostris darwini]